MKICTGVTCKKDWGGKVITSPTLSPFSVQILMPTCVMASSSFFLQAFSLSKGKLDRKAL
jgi:hypothetical protein